MGTRYPQAVSIYDGRSRKVATIFPGSGYTPDRPLLHYTRTVLRDAGWAGGDVWWPELPENLDALTTMVTDIASREIQADSPASQRLLVGKSMGSLVLPLAAVHNLPGVWFTPLVRYDQVVEALANLTAPTLLIGGTADEMWDGDAARASGHHVIEIEGADHSLEFPGDVKHSISALGEVVVAIEEFVALLDRVPEPGRIA